MTLLTPRLAIVFLLFEVNEAGPSLISRLTCGAMVAAAAGTANDRPANSFYTRFLPCREPEMPTLRVVLAAALPFAAVSAADVFELSLDDLVNHRSC
jgi:hypothetical protein